MTGGIYKYIGDNMKQIFTPLRVFVGGNLLLLLTFPFFPTIGQQSAQLASETAGVGSYFWGWSWLMATGVVKWLIYIILEGFIIYAMFRALWKQKVS